MGFTEAATLGMSTQMVELAADMSSAKNVPLAEALDKIRAGLIGESEPLRTMGVLLSEARVKEVAYAEGIAATGAELTVQEKVQARMNIILADSVAMHGDLINTQDSSANQWRAIKNVVFDAATTFGKKLLPAFTDVLGVMRTMVDRGVKFLEWVTATEDRMETLGAIMVGAVVAGIVAVTAGLWAMVPAITAATGGLNLVLPAIVVGVGLAAAAMWKFRDTIATVLVAAIDMYTGFVTGFLVQVHKIATLTDKVFGNDLAGVIANQASEIEQFRVDATESLRGYATSVQGADDATAGMADTLDVKLTPATAAAAAEVKRLAAAEKAFAGTIEDSSAAMDHWGSAYDGVGKQVELIPPFMSTLTGTIEDQSAAMDHWGTGYDGVGKQVELIPPKLDETEQSADKLNVTLAALAGGMGGAAGRR